MLLRELSQGSFDFSEKLYDQHAISVMVGEFYELLANQIFSGIRLDPALEGYMNGFKRRNGFMPKAISTPDLYCQKRKLGWEVKGAQKRTSHPVRFTQLRGFEKLLAYDEKFDKIEFAFFRYDNREALKEKTVIGLTDLLLERTSLMTVVDLGVISRLVENCRSEGLSRYINMRNYDSEEIFEVRQKFFEDLTLRPEEVVGYPGLVDLNLKTNTTKEMRCKFFNREMCFQKIELVSK